MTITAETRPSISLGVTAWRSVVVRGIFEELTVAAEREAALAALHGAYPDASRVVGSGVVFRIRPVVLVLNGNILVGSLGEVCFEGFFSGCA